ncbi:MAG: MFS transporter [Parachlamydiaceae bacterium]|nr:MFS transporter [Parachlamydiaceae bacterium]
MFFNKKDKKDHSFLGLLISQFFGAFNDNAWKVMVFTLATRPLLQQSVGDAEFELSSQLMATVSLLIFLIPMMLFSLPAGSLADRYSKGKIILGTKILEVVIMCGCTLSLYFAPTELVIPFVLLGMMGLQSALFSPSKYGIMPEILPLEKLSKGNGLLEMWSMIAIIAGTGLGPILLIADAGGTRPDLTWLGAFWLTILSIAGLFGAFFLTTPAPAKVSSRGMLTTLKDAWGAIQKDRALWVAIMGSLCYWTITSLLGQNILVYAKSLVKGLANGELLQGVPPASYGIGIALGALLGGKLSNGRIEYGFIPIGAIGFALTSMLLGIIQPDMIGTVIILIFMGISAGLLIVPLRATVQWKAPEDQRGSIIALGNILDIGGMIIGSLIAAGTSLLGFDLGMTLLASAFLVVIATIVAIKVFPQSLIRLFFIILAKIFYRLKIVGLENVPKEGPVLIASNHLSLADALFVLASVDRPVHFMMSDQYYNKWLIHPIAKLMEAIPISSGANTRLILQGLRKAGEYLDKGEVVCIFPEGQISLTGMMLPFKKGLETILRGRDCPIIPIHLDKVWGSIFSYENGRFYKKWPQKIPYPLTVSFGKPLEASTESANIRQVIKELEATVAIAQRNESAPIHHRFIRSARFSPFSQAIVDSNEKCSNFKTLTSSIALARQLQKNTGDQTAIGLLLPTSIPAILVNIAMTLLGKTAVNLNFTSGPSALESAISQGNLKTIVTSRKFVEKLKLELPRQCNILFLEDLSTAISKKEKVLSCLIAFFAPVSSISKLCGNALPIKGIDPLSIIFTSGSSGPPKGVVLSHFNLSSNVDAVSQVIPYMGSKVSMMASLPLFHTFGYMMMWLGLNHKIGLVVHHNPLDFKMIGELVKKNQVSLILTTPTFLRGYIKQVPAGQFGSLRCVLTGAEKLSNRLVDQFETHFCIRPIEGYGATECSPVIATSTLNIRQNGVCQIGYKEGSVGHPLPGVAVRVVNPETYEELPNDALGLLLVKGPNIMEGYLGQENLTKEVMHDGWYITGDLASVDADGFITIKDRIRRICKIGGEMVPLSLIEEALHNAADNDDRCFAVTAVEDSQKGECVAVLHTLEESQIEEILAKLSEQGLPKLYQPKLSHFIKVDELPILASGKIDLQQTKAIACKELKGKQEAQITAAEYG